MKTLPPWPWFALLLTLMCVGVGTTGATGGSSAPPSRLVPPVPAAEGVPSPTPARTRVRIDPALLPDTILRGGPDRLRIALTFDDGPHGGYTERLLDTLRAFDCPATFFVIGRNAEQWPHLVRLAARDGVEIGNHTWNHRRLPELSDKEVANELRATSDLVERLTGERPVWYRPPGGQRDPRVGAIATQLGLRLALWSAEAADYTTFAGNPTAQTIFANVMRNARPGAILILHDPMPGTLQALPAIILGLRARGYEFVTLSEIAACPRAVTTGSPSVQSDPALARRELERIGYLSPLTQKEAP